MEGNHRPLEPLFHLGYARTQLYSREWLSIGPTGIGHTAFQYGSLGKENGNTISKGKGKNTGEAEHFFN